MADPRFVTNAQGERVGVLLDLETYEQMLTGKDKLEDDPEVLAGVSEVELTALAESELAPSAQRQVQSLTEKSSEQTLSADEAEHLERLLEQIDYLNILKARARYTLQTKVYTARE